MRKNLVVFNGSFPKGMAMTKRLLLYTKGLKENGCDISVLARRFKQHREDDISGQINKIDFKSIDGGIIEKISFLPSRLKSIFYFLRLYIYIYRNRSVYNNFWCIGFSWFPLLVIIIIAKIFGARVIIELNELPNAIINSRLQNKLTNNIKQTLLYNIVFPRLDGFVVISENLKKLVERKKSSKSKIIKIPIIMDAQRIDETYSYMQNRFSKILIFHAGTLTDDKDGITNVFEAIGRLIVNNRNNGIYKKIKFVLSNKTTLPNVLKKINSVIHKYDLHENVVFYNHMDNEEYHWHLKNCSFVIINKPNNLRNSYNFATKLGEYMSYGIPIITTTVGESKQYLIDGENAYCLKDDSVECIIEKINELLGNQSRAIEIGIKSYETAISNFHYQKYALKLSNFLENL